MNYCLSIEPILKIINGIFFWRNLSSEAITTVFELRAQLSHKENAILRPFTLVILWQMCQTSTEPIASVTMGRNMYIY